MKLAGKSIVGKATKLITPTVGFLTFLQAANADNPGKPLPQQLSDTIARMIGKDAANMILVPIGLPGSGLAAKMNPLGILNKYSLGGIAALVAIHFAREYAPGGVKKYLGLATAVASGVAAGGFAGGFFDDPPGGSGGHSSVSHSAAVASIASSAARAGSYSTGTPMTTSNIWGTR